MRVLVISADLFEDRELIEPVDALRQAGVDVDIASTLSGTITGKRGGYVQANLAVTDVDPDDYDLLLLPGGQAPQTLRASEPVLDLARTFAEIGRPIAAICHGPQILISAGLVKGTPDDQPRVRGRGAEGGRGSLPGRAPGQGPHLHHIAHPERPSGLHRRDPRDAGAVQAGGRCAEDRRQVT